MRKASIFQSDEIVIASGNQSDTQQAMSRQRSRTSKTEQQQQREKFDRPGWNRHIEYILSSIGLCVGFGNTWRFPSKVIEHGGIVFVFQYLVLLILGGLSLYLLECAIGQFTAHGVLNAFSIVPAFKGVGWLALANALFIGTYYVMFMVYMLMYFMMSFSTPLPWTGCDKSKSGWEYCLMPGDNISNQQCLRLEECNKYSTPAKLFWQVDVLHMNKSTHKLKEMGELQPTLIYLLLICYIIIFTCVINGIKSSAKVLYFTTIVPYTLLFAITMVVFTSGDGGVVGIKTFFEPKWENILKIDAWSDALGQMFFSLSMGMGGTVMYSSYNIVHNRIDRDAVVIVSWDFVASVVFSITLFAEIGNLAGRYSAEPSEIMYHETGEFDEFFKIIPEAMQVLPNNKILSIFTFFLIFVMGLDSELAAILVLHGCLKDEFEFARRHSVVLLVGICCLMFVLGLQYTTQGGFKLLVVVDRFVVGISLGLCVLWEVVLIIWIYGINRFIIDFEYMIGERRFEVYWKYCWMFLAPALSVVLFIVSLSHEAKLQLSKDEYPDWLSTVVWLWILFLIFLVPVYSVFVVLKYRRQKMDWRKAFLPQPDWGPVNTVRYREYMLWKALKESGTAEYHDRVFV